MGAARLTLAEVAADPEPHVERIARLHDAPVVVGATFLVGRAAFAVARAALDEVVAGRPHPDLEPDELRLRFTEECRFADVEFGPATSQRDYRSAFAPLVAGVRDVVRVGERGLWGMVADGIGAAGNQLGTEGRAAADALLAEARPTFPTRPTWLPDGAVRRGMCCLAFRIDGHGRCGSCPANRADAYRCSTIARMPRPMRKSPPKP